MVEGAVGHRRRPLGYISIEGMVAATNNPAPPVRGLFRRRSIDRTAAETSISAVLEQMLANAAG